MISKISVLQDDSAEAIFIDVLDRILDKGIIVEAWVRISLQGCRVEIISPIVAGDVHIESDDLSGFFPYWRRDLWTK